jgi:hypothetical protein
MEEDLPQKSLLIIGAGGIGTTVVDLLVPALERIQLGAQITLMDGDTVEASNLGHQNYGAGDIGKKKVFCLSRKNRPKVKITYGKKQKEPFICISNFLRTNRRQKLSSKSVEYVLRNFFRKLLESLQESSEVSNFTNSEIKSLVWILQDLEKMIERCSNEIGPHVEAIPADIMPHSAKKQKSQRKVTKLVKGENCLIKERKKKTNRSSLGWTTDTRFQIERILEKSFIEIFSCYSLSEKQQRIMSSMEDIVNEILSMNWKSEQKLTMYYSSENLRDFEQLDGYDLVIVCVDRPEPRRLVHALDVPWIDLRCSGDGWMVFTSDSDSNLVAQMTPDHEPMSCQVEGALDAGNLEFGFSIAGTFGAQWILQQLRERRAPLQSIGSLTYGSFEFPKVSSPSMEVNA